MTKKKKGKNKIVKKKRKLTLKEKQNRQIMWAIILMATALLIVLLVSFIIKNYVNKFVYINLDFQKTKLGDMIFYSTRIPVTDKTGNIIAEYVMGYNKNNPKDLKYIEVNLYKEFVQFKSDGKIFISLDPEMNQCGDTIPALTNLAGFLRDFALYNVSSATTDPVYGELNNMSYATCEYRPMDNVLIINSGDETSIKQINTYCYELTYNDCEISQVTEKFYWTILEQYMKNFVRTK